LYPTPEDMSFGTFVDEQVKALRVRGVEVDVLFINGRKNRLNYLWGPLRLWKMMLSKKYDLIHAHYVFAGVIGRCQLTTPLVHSFHGAGEMEGWQGWLCKRLSAFVDGATVTSKRHHAHLGMAGARVVPCGADMELFRPMPKDECRGKLGLSPDEKLPLFAGAQRPEKRVPLIQEAVALVAKDDPKVRLLLASGIPHDEIPIWMNAADCLVLASDWEGSPVVIKEAMACDLPVVTVDVGDTTEVIDGVEGCWLSEQTADDLAANIHSALAFDGQCGGREAISKISLDHTIEGVLKLYKDVLKDKGRKSA
jgi:teichuronic acid biosynthesis glycosyltransferase TuaC